MSKRKFKEGDIAKVIKHVGNEGCLVRIGTKVKIVRYVPDVGPVYKYWAKTLNGQVKELFSPMELELLERGQ